MAAEELRKAADELRNGRHDLARKTLATYLQREPNSDQGWYLLSFALEDPKYQIECLQRARKINPVNYRVWQRLDQLAPPRSSMAPLRQPTSSSRAKVRVKVPTPVRPSRVQTRGRKPRASRPPSPMASRTQVRDPFATASWMQGPKLLAMTGFVLTYPHYTRRDRLEYFAYALLLLLSLFLLGYSLIVNSKFNYLGAMILSGLFTRGWAFYQKFTFPFNRAVRGLRRPSERARAVSPSARPGVQKAFKVSREQYAALAGKPLAGRGNGKEGRAAAGGARRRPRAPIQ